MGLASVVSACGTVTETFVDGPGSSLVDCELPWSSMDQVLECSDRSRYRVAETEGEQVVHIVVRQEQPDFIAAALAHAWSQIPRDVEGVVWAWSKPGAIGHGYDRGVVSEQGELGETLVFEICTEWESLQGPSDLCTDTLVFKVEQ
jgi:hypothetical protein